MERCRTEQEVSEIKQIKLSTLRNWRYKGVGPPYVKLNNRLVRYPESALEKYFEDHIVDLEK